MIKNSKSVSMSEALEYAKKADKSEIDIKGFIKKFVKLTPKEAKEMRKKLKELDLMKMKEDQISKVIDLMPENPEDLSKIFIDVGLNEDETKKILETVKQYK